MQLSIIIVNYNVKYFLEQCLYSVEKAVDGLDAEVWVVDNASSDGSLNYLQPKFSYVKFICNHQNVGFAKANNQALKKCAGELVLFLNPDTILPEDCLQSCITFLSSKTQAGALGIRMIDGSGKFLPESKRSFPSPITSFFKLIGLNSLFPRSTIFSRYSLGYLDEFKNHEVDVLAGAFFMAKRSLLNELNGFDETFFMYGEDIDLSYRIQKAGYENYYFSGSSIIHFKGESTRKGSLNYIKMFYNAMSVFVQKHYSGSKASLFRLFIQIAIWMKALLEGILKLVLKIGLPLMDAILIFASFKLVTYLWILYVREGHGFIDNLLNLALPGFTLVFLIAATLSGIYDNKYKPSRAFYSAVVAVVIMLAVYSLLPERFRFSRGVILFGGIVALLSITILRWFLLKWKVVEEADETKKRYQTIVVGTKEEFDEVQDLMIKSGLKNRIIGRVATNGSREDALGAFEDLNTLTETIHTKELVFCTGNLSYSTIIKTVQNLPRHLSIRFHAFGSSSIIGSDSKDTAGEYMSVDDNYQITEAYQKRMKRIVDVVVSLFMIATFPIHIILIGFNALVNAFNVLLYKRTWIGYSKPDNHLPKILPGILSTSGLPVNSLSSESAKTVNTIDQWYAKNYDWTQDIKMIIKNYKKLGARN